MLDIQHPRAKDLLGLWVPHNVGTYGLVGNGGAWMRDLSSYRRDAQFTFTAGNTDGKWVRDRAGTGFFLNGGQYGQLTVQPVRDSDWDFQGAFTLMCRIHLNVLDTGDASNRVFAGRTDGAGGGLKKWWWAWTFGGYSTAPAKRLLFFNIPLPGNETVYSTVEWDPNITDIYTMAFTRDINNTLRFYVDGYQLGDSVASTLATSIPDTLNLSWGYGEDFGSDLRGTYFWMKAWARDLSAAEVLAEYRSPWEMLRLPMSTAGGSDARGARVRAFWY